MSSRPTIQPVLARCSRGTGAAVLVTLLLLGVRHTWGAQCTCPTPGQSPCTPTAFMAAPASGTQIALEWCDTNAGTSKYRVERSPDGVTNWTTVSSCPQTVGLTSCTDTSTSSSPKTRFYYRASGWIAPNLSPPTAPTWAVSTYVGGPLWSWKNVKDFGALGNGTNDDSEEIQAAFDALGELWGDTRPEVLYFPNGTYTITRSLILSGKVGVQLIGESRDGVVIKWQGTGGTTSGGLVTARPMILAEGNTDYVLRNLTFDGGATNPAVPNYVVAFDVIWCGRTTASDPALITTCSANHFAVVDSFTCNCFASPYDESLGDWFVRDAVGLGGTVIDAQKSNEYADQDANFSDLVFKNTWIGVRLAHVDRGNISEETFRRCVFTNNDTGVSIEADNALNETFWDCTFEDNYRWGITNARPDFTGDGVVDDALAGYDNNGDGTAEYFSDGGGDFRVFRSVFRNNGVGAANTLRGDGYGQTGYFEAGDLVFNATGHVMVRDSTSIGSSTFFFGYGATAGASPVTLFRNKVGDWSDPSDPYYPPGHSDAVELRNGGPFYLVDNEFGPHKTLGSAPEPVATVATAAILTKIDLLALGNKFAANSGFFNLYPNVFRSLTIDNLTGQSISVVAPPPPIVLDQYAGRPVYTVSTGTPTGNAQKVINAALADPDPDGVIVHFPGGLGEYSLTQSLTATASKKLTIMGDGPATVIRWNGALGGRMLDIDGKSASSAFTIRDLQLNAAACATCASNPSNGIRIFDVNQPNSRVLISTTNVGSAYLDPAPSTPSVGFHSEKADRVVVDLADCTALMEPQVFSPNTSCGDCPYHTSDDTGFLVTTGPQVESASKGKHLWSGFFGSNNWDVDVQSGPNGVNALVTNLYMENSRHSTRVRGSAGDSPGKMLIANGKIATLNTDVNNRNAISIENFSGDVSTFGLAFYDQDVADRCQVKPGTCQATPVCGRCFDPPSSDEGARIEQSGSNPTRVVETTSVQTWTSQFSGGAAATFTGANNKYACDFPETIDPSALDCAIDSTNPPFVQVPDSVPQPTKTDLDAQVYQLRNEPLPRHYDESGGSATHQINIENVSIWNLAGVGVHLEGGIPAAPAGLTTTPKSGTRIDLTWNDVSNETGYDVERSLTSGAGFSVIASNLPANQSSYNNTTGLVEGTRYYYRIDANRGADIGPSGYSNESTARTLLNTPTSLSAAKNASGCSGIKLTWTDNSNLETSYQVSRTNSSGTSLFTTCAGGCSGTGIRTACDNNPGTGSISYTVKAKNSVIPVDSIASNTATITFP